jgi:hypothetical protein
MPGNMTILDSNGQIKRAFCRGNSPNKNSSFGFSLCTCLITIHYAPIEEQEIFNFLYNEYFASRCVSVERENYREEKARKSYNSVELQRLHLR